MKSPSSMIFGLTLNRYIEAHTCSWCVILKNAAKLSFLVSFISCIYNRQCCVCFSQLSLNVWQRVSIACYAERCLSYDRFCLTVRPCITVRYHAKTTPARIMRSSLEDSPLTLVSWGLTSARNSKGNIGSKGDEWERGSKNVAKIGHFSQ